jgi:xylulokinase
VQNCALSVDVGTTSVKAAVIESDGTVLGVGLAPHPTLAPQAGWSEHEPESTWRATRSAISAALSRASSVRAPISSLSITGPRGTVALAGPDDVLISNLLTWQDRRATDLVELAAGSIDAATYYGTTGMPLDPSGALLRLLWFRTQAHEVWSRTRQVVTPQALVLCRLGAEAPYTDWSTAAMFGLLDITTRRWSPTLLRAFGVPEEILPPLRPPGTVVGALSASCAADLGLKPGLPLVLASADGPCGELGAGVNSSSRLYAYVGTALGASVPQQVLQFDREARLIVMPGSMPDGWRVLALGMSGSSALDWFAGILAQRIGATLETLVGQSPPGARGVTFVPALAGEGSPFWHPRTRGAFVGLSLSTSRSDMVRAVLEGVAVELRLMVAALQRFGAKPAEFRLTGGGSRSAAWCTIVANAVQLPVRRMSDPSPSLRGAACYAFTAQGIHSSLLDASHVLESGGTVVDPDPCLSDVYSHKARNQLALRALLSDPAATGRSGADDRGTW